MLMKKSVLLSLVALGVLGAVGVAAGLGLVGGMESEEASPDVRASTTVPSPTPTVEPTPTPRTDGLVLLETPYEDLRGGGFILGIEVPKEEFSFSMAGWLTDFSNRSVPLSEILQGGPSRDGIPAIGNPKFTTPKLADEWLVAQDPVIALEINGDARAYPLHIIMRHEIVNDAVGSVPVVVTFCPLCNSAIVFERTLEGVLYDFGTTGNVRNSDLVMYDRQTES